MRPPSAASDNRSEKLRFGAGGVGVQPGAGYGANGIWQVNREGQPFGPSPHGSSWGDTPWTEAYRYPGSRQVGIGKEILTRFPWWRLEPHPDWVSGAATPDDPLGNHAAGIPGELRLIYFARPFVPWAVSSRSITSSCGLVPLYSPVQFSLTI